MSYLRKILLNPILWLGLGVGLAVGVVLSAGFGMDRGEAARFVGGVLGALIAVAGAVSLHFLKERRDSDKRLEQAKLMLNQVGAYNRGIIFEIEKGDFDQATAGLEVTNRYLHRWVRFCAAHEADDIRILRAASWLEVEDVEDHRRVVDSSLLDFDKAAIRELVEDIGDLVENASNALEQKAQE